MLIRLLNNFILQNHLFLLYHLQYQLIQYLHHSQFLVQEVKQAGDTVLEGSNSLARITEQATIANTEVALAVEEIAKGAINQAHDVELGAIKINELANKIEEVSQSTKNMSNLSNKTNELSNRGVEIVDLLKDRTKDNVNVSSKINKIILDMDKSSEEIGAITNTISEIAEQTNLLALNAAIEAARVNEEMLHILEYTQAMAGNKNEIVAMIENLSALSEETSASTEEVSASVEEQLAAMEEINNYVKDMEGVSQSLIQSILKLSKS